MRRPWHHVGARFAWQVGWAFVLALVVVTEPERWFTPVLAIIYVLNVAVVEWQAMELREFRAERRNRTHDLLGVVLTDRDGARVRPWNHAN